MQRALETHIRKRLRKLQSKAAVHDDDGGGSGGQEEIEKGDDLVVQGAAKPVQREL